MGNHPRRVLKDWPEHLREFRTAYMSDPQTQLADHLMLSRARRRELGSWIEFTACVPRSASIAGTETQFADILSDPGLIRFFRPPSFAIRPPRILYQPSIPFSRACRYRLLGRHPPHAGPLRRRLDGVRCPQRLDLFSYLGNRGLAVLRLPTGQPRLQPIPQRGQLVQIPFVRERLPDSRLVIL